MLNASGTKLILLQRNLAFPVETPEALDTALCHGSIALPVQYLGYQEGDPAAWDGRDIAYNFDEMSGHIYEIDGGSLNPELPCLLTAGDNLAAEFVPLSYNYADEYWLIEADARAIAAAEARRGLAVTYSAQLAVTDNGETIDLFRYERSGDQMLFELVYRNGEQSITAEFPAEYNEYDIWRAGAEDHPGMWDVLFLARIESGLLMATLWSGPEGGNLHIWTETDGVWQPSETIGAYMYWF